jgi:hypothetical protein
MAVAVYSSAQTWAGPDKGLQMFGTCAVASGARASKAEQLYARRFAQYARWKAGRKPGDAARAYRFFRFVPQKLKVLDELEFGEALFVSAAVK